MSGNIPFRDDRTLAYLNIEGADRPLKSPLPGDTLDRACRLSRLRLPIDRHDVAGLLLDDPVNIRYAFDCSNPSIWTSYSSLGYAQILNSVPGACSNAKALNT